MAEHRSEPSPLTPEHRAEFDGIYDRAHERLVPFLDWVVSLPCTPAAVTAVLRACLDTAAALAMRFDVTRDVFEDCGRTSWKLAQRVTREIDAEDGA